ncbi:hypothetical protein SO802_012466 [Lithocarpus litseifolius]|uniref:Retrovirus-related Pol polyprotein from transposon TNT 1-94-like beta-barrel domain-containing protein n=1 Tax=Lithocarpus litseifolius TaxID=425828 RepID=A0AAW2D2V3_9ROSI
MIIFLKGCKLWWYVIGLIPKPMSLSQSKATTGANASKTTAIIEDDYEACLEEWESIQIKELISEEYRQPTYHMSYSDHVLATPSPPSQLPITAFTAPPRISSIHLTSQSSKGTRCEFYSAKGHDISIFCKLQKFKQKQNKAPLPRVAAMCPSDLSVSTSPSSASSFTTVDIKAVVEHVLSQTSIALSVTSGKDSWFFDTACCNHMTPDESQFFDKAPLAHPISIHTTNGTPMPISHKGTISSPSLSLSDTFHIPKLSLNLLSVGQLCELGVDILSTNHGMNV